MRRLIVQKAVSFMPKFQGYKISRVDQSNHNYHQSKLLVIRWGTVARKTVYTPIDNEFAGKRNVSNRGTSNSQNEKSLGGGGEVGKNGNTGIVQLRFNSGL